MAWDEEKFSRFLEAVLQMARGDLRGYGYRHVIFPYPPKEEPAAIQALRTLPSLMSQRGRQATVLPVSRFVAKALERYARRPLGDREDYQRLETDLSDPQDGLAAMAAKVCAQEIRSVSSDVVALGRLGALYPFAHVSTFLEHLQRNGVQTTLAVAYPGTAEGTRLSFLGVLDPTGGYRGHVVT